MGDTFIPKYSAHTTVNFVLGFPLAYFGFCQQKTIPLEFVGLATLSFVVGTFLLSPDLDLRNSTPTKNWGILKVIWIGYHKLFRHRGKSHSLLFASLSKVLYLSVVGCIMGSLGILVNKFFKGNDLSAGLESSVNDLKLYQEIIFQNVIAYKDYWLSCLAGIALSDWIHICTDRICTRVKRYN